MKAWTDCFKNFCFFIHLYWPDIELYYERFVCRIKTGHSNLVSWFGPRMRALAKVFYRGESRGKIPCQRPNPRAKTWHKIWMAGLNPNYDTIPIPSLQNSQNKCQKSSFTYDRRRHFILPLVTASARPPNFEYTHLLLKSADWWRHNIPFSITRTIWILNECKLSTDNYVNY